ncbi:hypothetical protein L6164_020491 [Bauhinia variegata]|uniref:Uncharacterized protein n=1 Tax=Bauhinia variegata TaxID=167791 RepID=A0ACB9MVB1_BAUVA|nr:hypothetical protein L6164_020491 [Bauhinia variegata]
MERDPTTRHQSSYFSGCMSPSFLPVHDEFRYTRVHSCSNHHNQRRGQRWRNILRKLMREGMSLCGSKQLSFQYDPVSYSQNFDEGCHLEDPRRHSHLFRHDVSAAASAHRHCSLVHPTNE